jgi:hypothetical protein
MNVPKWLIPVISVIASLALGVAMAFVGASFASKRVVETAAGSTTAQVIQPVATGLTNQEIADLSSNGKLPASPITGTVQVSLPGGRSVKPPLDREVDLVASGGSGSSSPTPTSTALPDASSVGVTPYPSGQSGLVAIDPCATGSGGPASCPNGLRSVILSLTAPPAPEFTIVPFEAPCTPTSTPDSRFSGRANVQVTLSSTVPMNYSVHYQSEQPLLQSNDATQVVGPILHGVVPFTTDPAEVATWNAARERDVPAASLPGLTTCARFSDLWANGSLVLDVTGTATDGTSIVHHLTMNPSGPGTPGPLRVQTYGADAFVAYGDSPTGQVLRIQAYTLTTVSGVSCDDVGARHELAAVYSRSDTIDPGTIAEAAEPPDFTKRTASGFRVPVGSEILVCGRWYNGRGSASFDRLRYLRSSQIAVASPSLQGQVSVRTVFRQLGHEGGLDQLRGDIARVHVYATLDDGTPCGSSYDWVPGYDSGEGTTICTAPTNESLDVATGGFTNAPQRADVNVTIETIGRTHGRAHSTYRINLEEPVCDDGCTASQIQDETFNMYHTNLPDPFSNPFDGPGAIQIDSGWISQGTSDTPYWTVSPPLNHGAEDNPIDAPPRPNTDSRLVVDNARTTPTDLTARLDYSADTEGSYRLELHNATGGVPCTVDGSTSVSISGTYPVARAVVPIYIPHLCHGTAYVATLDSIEDLDPNAPDPAYSSWGPLGYSAWPGLVLLTPWVPVEIVYSEVVTVPAGSGLSDLNLHLDGLDVHPDTDLVAGCAAQRVVHISRAFLSLATRSQLHLQYRMRHVTSAAGQPCTFPRTDVAPLIDAYRTIDLNAVMANPTGIQIVSGPYTITMQITPVR